MISSVTSQMEGLWPTTGVRAPTAPTVPSSGEDRSPSGAAPGEGEAAPPADAATGQRELTEAEREQVRELRARDREVRAHEQAHSAAGGGLVTGGPSFQFEMGPDGRRYAVGGEVSIDVSAVPNDPAATIRKAQAVRRAALAPASPSAQDRQVASRASAMEQQARVKLAQEHGARVSAGEAYGGGAPAPTGAAPEPLDLVA